MSFLNAATAPDTFAQEIMDEVDACLAATAKRGAGVVIITDGPATRIAREHVCVLLSALTTGALPIRMASYVADALIMSEDFDFADDVTSEAVFFLADESRPLTIEDVRSARSSLEP